ncbi:hypothetical protein SELR_pSRC400510 (plasmid) [Selenomonas ruminantium subsp. lactilytica TAM6421]|uniref:Uncharacterized protein n=1 Tax=Selenomonas ruminantium subsp. lactilytica (strain NBRC 103574 / TAM6421) TaxID=927704 RepID=I0GVB5_SELRL|nr:hypothetical protein [Selenomonas ruminantium]BAL84702.1 hypothetical protein SELR_pSRC400510 [Selenomonas ruminantium subsp. lactilytica TAM6421]
MQGIVECPDCHVRHVRLIKKDISKSVIDIHCGGCDKVLGSIHDYMVDEPSVKQVATLDELEADNA